MIYSTVEVPETLGLRTLEELIAQLNAERSGPSVAVVLRGASPAVFCRGMDFRELTEGRSALRGIEFFAECLELIREFPKPTIAVVDGEVLAGGVGICAASDYVLASPNASFGLSEGLFGLIPAVVLPYLMERMVPQKARLFALRASSRSAREMRELGLVDDVAETSDLLHSLLRREIKNFSRSAPESAGRLKAYLRKLEGSTRIQALETARAEIGALLRDETILARIRDFVDHGKLPWLDSNEGEL